MKLSHKFVEFVPNVLEKGVLYVSVTYGTASHLCCCGCGREVVTPITPTGWKLIFDGETVSLDPSIGNWNFPCRSHYWISNNRVEWAWKSDKKQKTKKKGRESFLEKLFYRNNDSPTDKPKTEKQHD